MSFRISADKPLNSGFPLTNFQGQRDVHIVFFFYFLVIPKREKVPIIAARGEPAPGGTREL
jgi:hypothetical protein